MNYFNNNSSFISLKLMNHILDIIKNFHWKKYLKIIDILKDNYYTNLPFDIQLTQKF